MTSPLRLEAGKLIRELIIAHKHNVTGNYWENLTIGQQESWKQVAEQFVRSLEEGKREEGSVEGSLKLTPEEAEKLVDDLTDAYCNYFDSAREMTSKSDGEKYRAARALVIAHLTGKGAKS